MSGKYVMSEEEKKALRFAQIEWPEADVAYLFGRIGDKSFFHVRCSLHNGYVGALWFVGEKDGHYWWLDDDEIYVMHRTIRLAKEREQNRGKL